MNPASPLSVMSTLMFTVVGFFAVASGDRRNDQRIWGDHVFTNVQVYVCGGTKLSTITSVPFLLRRRFPLLTTFPVEMPHGQSERQMAKCVPPSA